MKPELPPIVIARPIPKSERITHKLIPPINIQMPPSEKALPPRIVFEPVAAPAKIVPSRMEPLEAVPPPEVAPERVTPAVPPPQPVEVVSVEAVLTQPAPTKPAQTSSHRESIVLALTKAISVLENADTKVFRNLDKPINLPTGGLIILRDNEPAKEVDVLLSPLTYTFELTTQIEAMIQHPDGNTRSRQLDLLISLLSNAIAVNKTLNGLAEYVEVQPAEFQDEPVEGAATIRSAVLPVLIRYTEL